jgi:hypothetical protein
MKIQFNPFQIIFPKALPNHLKSEINLNPNPNLFKIFPKS